MLSKLVVCVVAATFAGSAWSEDNKEGVGERAGRAVDKAAKKTGEVAKKVGQSVGKGLERAGKAVERGGRKAGEAVGTALERTGEAVGKAGKKVQQSSKGGGEEKK
jgi:hypothetical protein